MVDSVPKYNIANAHINMIRTKTQNAFCTVELYVFVNNIQPLRVATEKQQWFHFELLSSYKIFRTVINNKST